MILKRQFAWPCALKRAIFSARIQRARYVKSPSCRKVLVAAAIWLVTAPVQVSAQLPESTRSDAFILLREGLVTPKGLGAPGLDGLGIAEPLAQMVLVEPPVANNQGNAELVYPLDLPRGRAGVQPELALAYDSGGGNGQVGMGWSLSTSEISVDTRWGVPRYLGGEESETYMLDGAALAPTAVRAARLPREADRIFTRRVEGSFERIRRRGARPGEFWWEVTDNIGTVRYYGGSPEGGRDPSAILATDEGKGFSWALTEIRDLSGNVARFQYQIVAGNGVGGYGGAIGRDIYLDRIVYTGTILPCTAEIPDCDVVPYEVDIVRASEVPESYQRADVPVDALGGFLRVTSDLIYRIDVYYLGELARRYVLNYETGVFGKTRLASVGQAGRDGVVWAEHEFGYFEDVLDTSGNYRGFAATPETWDTGQDGIGAPGIDLGGEFHGSASALGGVAGLTLLAVEGYVGFNPLAPTKTGSFGAGFQGSRATSNSLLEMLDINGDALPDKLFSESGAVQQRLNRSGPAGITSFSGPQAVGGVSDLSREIGWTAQGGGEVYLGVTVIAHRGNTFSEGRSYFIDVNGDLRPDRVSNGQVFFNYANGGAAHFSTDSSLTAVPLAAGSVSEAVLPDLSELEAEQRENSPLIDTLRRWRAPWPGTVSVAGDVSLIAPAPDGIPGDGVRVAIQKDGTELWAATIDAGDFDPRTPTGVSNIAVNKGEDLYFRVQSLDDGASDQVLWNPEIQYAGVAPAHDANGLPVYQYRASNDFTLGGRTGSVASASLDGTVRVEGDLHKAAKTTDDVVMKVYRSGVEVASQLVGRDETGDFPFAAEFAVTNPDGGQHEILVRLQIDSPVDLSSLSWAPLIYYLDATSQGEPVTVTDSEGNPTHVINAAVDYQMYPANSLGAPQQTWTAPWSRTVIGDPEIGFAGGSTPTGSVVVTVKKLITPAAAGDPPSERVLKKRLNFVDGVLQNDDPTFTFSVSENARYWFDFSAADPAFAMDWNAATLRLRFEADGDTEATPTSARHWAYIPATVFPMAYRGWGIAGYDGNGSRATQPVAEGRLIFDEDDYSDETENPDPPKPKAFVYAPFVGEVSSGAAVMEWRGPKSNLFGSATTLGSSRLGSDSIGLPDPGQGAGTFGVSRVSESPQWSVVGGLAGILGVTAAWGPGVGLLDYLDMNGDQFPDIVGPTAIQYTSPRGGLEPEVVDVCSGVVRRDSSMTISGGLDISLASVETDPKGQSNTAQKAKSKSGQKGKGGTGKGNGGQQGDANNSSELTLGLSGSLGRSLTNFPESEFPADIDFSGAMSRIANRYSDCGPLPSGEQDLADLNGDGLPDRIKVDNQGSISVNFNLGYGFDSTDIPWPSPYPGFETGFTDSFSVGVPLGFSVGAKAYGGGLAASASRTHQKVTWADLNGDGLLDQLVNTFGMDGVLDGLEATDVLVAFGTGSGLTPHRAWPNFPLQENTPISQELLPDIAKSVTVGVGAGGYFTYAIGPLCVGACYIILGVGGGADTSMTRQTTELVDVDGDGYLDHVTSDRDQSMSVARNSTGRTNLLREVRNPIGGAIRLRYERAGNTPEAPYSQWVMSEVELDDGRPGDGTDLQLTRYAYSDNRFDHLERETLGYARVTEQQLDTANGQQVMRTIAREYLNDSVFTKGLMVSERLEGPGWGPFMEIRNSWSFVNVATGAEADLERPGVELLELAVFPRLARIDQRWFENNAVSRSTFWEFEHDRRGNVVEVLDIGEPGDADDMTVSMTYGCQEGARTAEETWVNLPLSLEIRLVVGGELLRKRRAEQLCANNSPTALWEDHGDGESFTQLEYDFWGNYGHIVYPENHKGERYEVRYTFDSPRYTDIARVEDSFGLVATAAYLGTNGELVSRTDPNGQQTRYTYDAQGRLATITAPYEQGAGHPTIAFEYFPGAAYAYALAHHYDASRPGDTIDTAAFVDGLGRLTQSKQDATVFRGAGQPAEDVTIVSGALEFDALGRVVREWYPAEEPKGAMATFNPLRDSVEPTRTRWTFFDELSEVVAPNAAVNAFEYTFDRAVAEAGNMLVATGTDPNGNVSRTFTNMAGYIEFEEQDLLIDGVPSTLQYVVLWDSLDQFIGLIDPDGNETIHELDLQGRRVATETPDGGRVEFVYDDDARLVQKITPNLRAAGQSIRYEHDFNRLVAVDYPDATPDIAYEYGPASAAGDAAGNAAGRLVRMEDGTRIQEQRFGRMGEVIEETNTMLVHNSTGKDPEKVTWTMAYEFDTWGRLHEMTYPDGEVVSYRFDAGGLIDAVSGLDAGNAYPYVTAQAYDKFAMRRYQETGNGVNTLTTYYPDSRWLEGHRTDGPDRDVQDITYTYDLAGNVLSIANAAPKPVPSLMGGTSEHRYAYDELHRLVAGSGTYEFGSGKTREYSYEVEFDALGNVTWKRQADAIHAGRGKGAGKGKGANTPVPQFPTTYEYAYRYGAAPHQAVQIGDKDYRYDANGNLLGWEAAGNGTRRRLDWDAEDRLVRVADQGSSTEYRYDDAGRLSVERGPQGETLLVNRYYAVRNANVAWKNVWAGDDQVATKREKDRDLYEDQLFLLHKDLRGNVRIVTDPNGTIYEYLEYFPGGEGWVVEHSNTERVPYRFLSGYYDEDRALYNLGARWYEPREQVFHSSDPVLTEMPQSAVANPALLAAYTFGDNNPLRFTDRDGRAPVDALLDHLEKRYLGADAAFSREDRARFRAQVGGMTAFPEVLTDTPGVRGAVQRFGEEALRGLKRQIAKPGRVKFWKRASYEAPSVIKVKVGRDAETGEKYVKSARVFKKKFTFKQKKAK